MVEEGFGKGGADLRQLGADGLKSNCNSGMMGVSDDCLQTGGDRVAYSELIKNFNRIRDYMREFYVYGFKSREEYTKKDASSRSR